MYDYKVGVCIHCGRDLMCGKGVAHFWCSYKAQEAVERYRKFIIEEGRRTEGKE